MRLLLAVLPEFYRRARSTKSLFAGAAGVAVGAVLAEGDRPRFSYFDATNDFCVEFVCQDQPARADVGASAVIAKSKANDRFPPIADIRCWPSPRGCYARAMGNPFRFRPAGPFRGRSRSGP